MKQPTDNTARLVQDFENGTLSRIQPPPRRPLELRRWAYALLVALGLFLVAAHVANKGLPQTALDAVCTYPIPERG